LKFESDIGAVVLEPRRGEDERLIEKIPHSQPKERKGLTYRLTWFAVKRASGHHIIGVYFDMILDLCFQMFRQIALRKGNLDEKKKRSRKAFKPTRRRRKVNG
jgi:hypothetical protein